MTYICGWKESEMEMQDQNIQEKLRQLIIHSCEFDEFPKKEFQNFHVDFLKFYFSALYIKIDYTSKSIFLWNSKPMGKSSLQLYDLNTAVSETVSYTNLEETMLGCIEAGEFQERFYKHLLFEYGNIHLEGGSMISA